MTEIQPFPPRYIHGTSPREQSRLELMNGILNSRCLAAMELRGGERILEMGAGTGLFAADLARQAGPGGAVLALEIDEEQFAAAARRAANPRAPFEVRRGDAMHPPLRAAEWGTFDVVHARFLLEHVPQPADVVRAMVRAARPGGRIVLVDDDHSLMRFWPEPGGMEKLWFDYAAQYERVQNDPWVGRRLVELLVQAGATPLRTTLIPYGGCAGEPAFPATVENLAEVIEGARGPVLENTAWTAEEFDATVARFRAWGARDDAVIWYALPFAEGIADE